VSAERWIFVRHGQSVANAEGWYSGHRDVDLTAAGEAAAVALGASLAEVPFVRAYASDLRRARRTAELLLGGRAVPLVCDPALRERDVGAWTGVPFAELPEDERHHRMRGWDTRPPGGESLADVASRAIGWLAQAPPAPATLLVAHGGTLRALLARIDGLEADGAPRPSLDNTAPEERWLAPGTWARLAAGR
jgi:broad specificity phosphatase PhoE